MLVHLKKTKTLLVQVLIKTNTRLPSIFITVGLHSETGGASSQKIPISAQCLLAYGVQSDSDLYFSSASAQEDHTYERGM